MIVRRTGAKKGEKPTYYVWADVPEERVALRAGLLEEKAPGGQFFQDVLAWGFKSRSAAREAMAALETRVDMAIEAVWDAQEMVCVAELDSPQAMERVVDALREMVDTDDDSG